MSQSAKTLILYILIALTVMLSAGVERSKGVPVSNGITKLFVFGDSYADTGNWAQPTLPWDLPYGITFPGKPAGRFSNGRILTDFLAPYQQRNSSGLTLKFGMNFAYGGTGVFDTTVSLPNMTTQIDLFQQQIGQVYTQIDLASSLALVSLVGNDYVTYLRGRSSHEGDDDFAKSVVDQLALNLKRIHDLGVPRVAVTTLQSVGCLPSVTFFFGYRKCIDGIDGLAHFHDELLMRSVDKLNGQAEAPVFFILNLYDGFMAALKPGGESSSFESPFMPCCQGETIQYKCGSREGDQIKYTTCEKPDSAFFWDSVHPTQQGWKAVYMAIRSSLPPL